MGYIMARPTKKKPEPKKPTGFGLASHRPEGKKYTGSRYWATDKVIDDAKTY